MTDTRQDTGPGDDKAPGEEGGGGSGVARGVRGYAIGLALATLLTAASFYSLRSGLIWEPAIPVALIVFAITQMGVHLVFFLHITSGPDNSNNLLALAFGVLIVFLVVTGSLWIMSHLDHNMMPMDQVMSHMS